MAGMSVVVVKCDALGNVDMADLEAKCRQHSDKLAAIMITYPSTYGVFDPHVQASCARWCTGMAGASTSTAPT